LTFYTVPAFLFSKEPNTDSKVVLSNLKYLPSPLASLSRVIEIIGKTFLDLTGFLEEDLPLE
jgi:hypothetical protein